MKSFIDESRAYTFLMECKQCVCIATLESHKEFFSLDNEALNTKSITRLYRESIFIVTRFHGAKTYHSNYSSVQAFLIDQGYEYESELGWYKTKDGITIFASINEVQLHDPL